MTSGWITQFHSCLQNFGAIKRIVAKKEEQIGFRIMRNNRTVISGMESP